MLYQSLVISTALYGCESWSVTSEIERRLQSLQTRHLRSMLHIRLAQQVRGHISSVQMQNKLGAKSILYYMHFLQLSWLETVRRIPLNR